MVATRGLTVVVLLFLLTNLVNVFFLHQKSQAFGEIGFILIRGRNHFYTLEKWQERFMETIVRDNRRHLATPPLVFPQNYVWETRAKIPYWWRVTNPDLGSASDWSCSERNLLHPIRGTTQILVVTRHQYGISTLDCRLFSQAMKTSEKVKN